MDILYFCTKLGGGEVILISVGLQRAVSVPNIGKNSCLQSVSDADEAERTVHIPPVPRNAVFTFVIQLHKYRPSLPGTSARVFTYTQLSALVICAVKLVAPSCSRRPYRNLYSGRMVA